MAYWRKQGNLLHLLFGMLLVTVFFVSLEIIFRLLFPVASANTYYRLPADAVPGSEVEDRDLFWANAGKHQRVCQALQKYQGSNLVFAFGGSIMAGHGLEPGTDIAHQVIGKLKNSVPDAEVVNMTYPGYTTYQARILLDRYLPLHTPRLVLLSNGYNDRLRVSMTYNNMHKRNLHWSRGLLQAFQRSRMFSVYRNYMLQVIQKNKNPMTTKRYRAVPLEDYRDNLEYMAGACADANVNMVFITQAMPVLEYQAEMNKYFHVMAEVAAANDHVFLADVRPAFDRSRKERNIPYLKKLDADRLKTVEEYNNALFLDACCHPTLFGSGLYADAVYQVILENGLLAGMARE